MHYRRLRALAVVLGTGLGCIAAASAAAAACQMQQFAELPVDSETGAPVLKTQVNGQTAMLIVETGTNVTFLSRTAAAELGLKPKSLIHVNAYGDKGEVHIQQVTISDFAFGNLHLKDYEIFVVDDKFSEKKIAGEVGGNTLFSHDVDFDLPERVIRLLRPVGCKGAEVVFWNKQYSTAPLTGFDEDLKHFYTTVMVNGQRTEALINTGSEASVLNYEAAVKLGLKLSAKPPSTGKVAGVDASSQYIGQVSSFALGDEVIRNTTIQVRRDPRPVAFAETGTRLGAESYASNMVLGADFFRAHHVLIAKSQNMLYFSYMGGPVFDLTASTRAAASPAGGTPTPGPLTPGTPATR